MRREFPFSLRCDFLEKTSENSLQQSEIDLMVLSSSFSFSLKTSISLINVFAVKIPDNSSWKFIRKIFREKI